MPCHKALRPDVQNAKVTSQVTKAKKNILVLLFFIVTKAASDVASKAKQPGNAWFREKISLDK